MNKYLLAGAASLLFATAANAGTASGTLHDGDGSSTVLNWNSSTTDNQFDDAGSPISARFTLKGQVTKTCSMQAVDAADEDNHGTGLAGTINMGTIGIRGGDELAVGQLFTMTGPAHVTIKSAAAGCNYKSTVRVDKDNALGLVNTSPGGYDSNQFQANIPYSATASFTATTASSVTGGTAQTVTVSDTATTNSGNFGAWRSPLQLDVDMPVVTGKGLVGGEYQGVVTLTISLT